MNLIGMWQVVTRAWGPKSPGNCLDRKKLFKQPSFPFFAREVR